MSDNINSRVKKAYLAESGELNQLPHGQRPTIDQDGRGLDIYNITELQGVSGRGKNGNILTGTVQRPVFSLSIQDRIEMFKRSSMLQGVVTSRAKRVSALNWKVVKKNIDDQRFVAEIKEYKEIFSEFSDSKDIKELTIAFQIKQRIMSMLPGLKDDMSNFDSALRRHRRRNDRANEDTSTEIEEWISQPSMGVNFSRFLHELTIDLMIHGSDGIYKEYNTDNTKLENFYMLPGGTIFPYRQVHVGGPEIYFQIIPSLEAKAYFSNEISYLRYVPVSWQTMGEVPLEALINKVAESILFDKRSADQADGTKPPEKAIAFGKQPAPMGGLTDNMFELPMNDGEQKRIETKLNQARQEAIITLSGVGTPTVIDLSKADTFGAQQTRQDKLLRDVALIYNMTNMEVNLAGGEFTSGKETSDVQKEIEQEKGIGPIIGMIEEFINRDILPYRYGYDFEFKFDIGLSEQEQVELEDKKIKTGTYAVNEIREARGDDVYPEEQYNRPEQGASMESPDGSQGSPFNIQGPAPAPEPEPAEVIETVDEVTEEEPIEDTAMNGAQVTSALEIVSKVNNNEISRSSGVAMLKHFFGKTKEQAEEILGEDPTPGIKPIQEKPIV